MTLQHLLVPVDFSGETPDTLAFALELAGRFSAHLTLFHVVEQVVLPIGDFHLTGDTVAMTAAYTENLIAAAQHQMTTLGAGIPAGVPFDTSIKVGIPWHCIVQYATDHPIDLVVMSTHGRSGLKHLWLGSVAERVVQNAPCPVLVVRPRTGGSPPLSLSSRSTTNHQTPNPRTKHYERDYALESPT